MQGLFVRGKTASGGEALKSTQGAANNKITADHLVEHKHGITDPGHDHDGATGNFDTSHTHTMQTVQGIGSTAQGAADAAASPGAGPATQATNSGGSNHTHSIPNKTTGITETDNGNGVTAGLQEEYAPEHYVINYIIYKGPLGA
jgi:microcystin-dependent protein